MLSLFCWLIMLLARDHDRDWQAAGRLAWSLTILTAVALIARGIFLGRPVTAAHAWLALAAVLAGLGAHVLAFDLLGDVLIASAGVLLMWPTAARPNPAELPRIWALVDTTDGRPACAVRHAAVEVLSLQRRRHGGASPTARGWAIAVVSGDPIGDETRFAELVADFAAMCHTRGWRIVVLGCSERRLELWADATVLGQSLHAGADRARRGHRRRDVRHGRAQVPQPASGGAAHAELRCHHRGRCRAGPRRPHACRADGGAAGVAERSTHRARVLDVPRRCTARADIPGCS